jgi:hypothetical protein
MGIIIVKAVKWIDTRRRSTMGPPVLRPWRIEFHSMNESCFPKMFYDFVKCSKCPEWNIDETKKNKKTKTKTSNGNKQAIFVIRRSCRPSKVPSVP